MIYEKQFSKKLFLLYNYYKIKIRSDGIMRLRIAFELNIFFSNDIISNELECIVLSKEETLKRS